jgi:choline-sulfatase
MPLLPNVVLIQTDQMCCSAMPFHGNSVVKAPHMASLAASGIVFDNMYCNYPLCAPSRASMMSGRLASSIGVYDNGAEFQASVPTLAHVLRAAGYRTCLSGKMHFVGPDQLHGFEERITTDIYPSDFSWTADWQRQHGTNTGEMRVVTEAGSCQRSVQVDFDDEVAFRANRWLFDLARSRDASPFFLTVSFTHPHDPFSITAPYWDRYSDEEIDMPNLPRSEDPHSRRIRAHFGMDEAGLSADTVRAARHAYYGAISYIDDKIGELRQTLESCGYGENTIVILTSDHGEFLGERDLWFKRSFFEQSARVPFVVHAPGRVGAARVAQNCSLIDLLPTLAEFAQAEIPFAVDGQSLVGLLGGNSDGRSDVVYAELMSETTPATVHMVKKGPHKYIYCALDPAQLYDLSNDPEEHDNLAGKPEFQSLLEELHQLAEQRWNLSGLAARVKESQLVRQFVMKGLREGDYKAWDHTPDFNGDRLYYRNNLASSIDIVIARALMVGVLKRDHAGIHHNDINIGVDDTKAIAYLSRDPDMLNALIRQVEETRSFLR